MDRSVRVVALHTFKECLRRRVFLVVPIVTAVFLALFALGVHYAFRSVDAAEMAGRQFVDQRSLAGATLMGLSMFVTLFLGSALAIFLTFSTIRGDSEIGVLQPLVVRPVARSGLLIGRLAGASIICVAYVLVLYFGAMLITGLTGNWWPDPIVLPALQLALAVVTVTALSLLGSTMMPALANGIGMFMIYGAGLLAGLLSQLGEVLDSPALARTGHIASWVLPFEALYQSSLDSLTSNATGITRVLVQLGPLGGAHPGGAWLIAWSLVYIAAVAGLTVLAFSRSDL